MSECDAVETCMNRDCIACHRETLLWTLERTFSMRILMWLEVSGPDTLRGIMDGVTDDRNKEKEIFIRIQELAELGLVQTVRAHPGQSGAKVLRQLTPEGHRVAKRLLAFFEEMGEGCE